MDVPQVFRHAPNLGGKAIRGCCHKKVQRISLSGGAGGGNGLFQRGKGFRQTRKLGFEGWVGARSDLNALDANRINDLDGGQSFRIGTSRVEWKAQTLARSTEGEDRMQSKGWSGSQDVEAIEPYRIDVPEAALQDLNLRLSMTRWPEIETVGDTSQGARLAEVKALCRYWASDYDWRRCEAQINALGQFRTRIDGLRFHFLHIRSPEPDALPLLITHGWPGSVIEFHKVIGPLTDPVGHGASRKDAFHLILPSLPGFAFSDKPEAPGWGVDRIADAWIVLMGRLGYKRWGVQGGDWGAAVGRAIALKRPVGCVGLHLNLVQVKPTDAEIAAASDEEAAILAHARRFATDGAGYSIQQATRPQTLAYGLADSPAGQAAWIYEKLHEWSDREGHREAIFSMDEMLDNIMLYWLPNAAASSARLYWEGRREARPKAIIDLPVGLSLFPRELARVSRRWAERMFTQIVHWNELEKGGHFAAFEQPDVFVREVRSTFASLRRPTRNDPTSV